MLFAGVMEDRILGCWGWRKRDICSSGLEKIDGTGVIVELCEKVVE